MLVDMYTPRESEVSNECGNHLQHGLFYTVSIIAHQQEYYTTCSCQGQHDIFQLDDGTSNNDPLHLQIVDAIRLAVMGLQELRFYAFFDIFYAWRVLKEVQHNDEEYFEALSPSRAFAGDRCADLSSTQRNRTSNEKIQHLRDASILWISTLDLTWVDGVEEEDHVEGCEPVTRETKS
ncbi:hypothetical protein BDN70DRAFT_441005 [Pholiota conissans]|uniref:Uncharacterized protein n=1 Tax=Pholiota conissans TaxID=109636 RepID=A0A9P5YMX1_9AGAR|nr:hypothetical protein BDN70DRAFT_441005 [Pholiota conissans]